MENVIFKNICHEIMRECNNRGIKISEKFSAYYVKLLLLDPKWNISLEKEEINRIDLQKLVKYAVDRLNNEIAPSMITLKMQMYFECTFDTSSSIIFKHRDNLRNKLIPLEEEILAFTGGNEDELEKLYKKIVYFLTLNYGLGNPADPMVYKEANVALRSVFNSNDLTEFINLSYKTDKQEQLKELSYLLAGVRLFNRDCNKGGQGIEDLPMLLTHAIDITTNDLETTLEDIMKNINKVTTALDLSFVVSMKGPRSVLNLIVNDDVSLPEVEYAKDYLVCYRQFEVQIRKILFEVENLDEKSQSIFDECQWCLIEVHRCVQYKTAVSAKIVYPLFNKLAGIWHTMQDMVIYLSKVNQIFVNLQTYMKQLLFIEEMLNDMIGDNPILTDAERLSLVEDIVKTDLTAVSIATSLKVENYDEQPLQFLGFCPWKFVESQGALIPGNPAYGVVEHEGKNYVFSTARAAQSFARTPKRFIHEALDIVRRKPELAHFLELYEQLMAVRDVHQLVTKTLDAIITHEVEIQTDLHPQTNKKDLEYFWNVWDLKRNALAMADMSKRVTHSTQTVQSNNRNTVRVQTYETKDHCYQTKKDNYSNVPILSNFVYGLRGRKDDKQFIITLTRPVDE